MDTSNALKSERANISICTIESRVPHERHETRSRRYERNHSDAYGL